jgi:ATP-dependent DNA helicase RecG
MEILKDGDKPLEILPIYSVSEELKKSRMEQRFLRKMMFQSIAVPNLNLTHSIPEKAARDLGFIEEFENLRRLHFPDNMGEIKNARRQLKLEELWPIALQLSKDYLQSIDNGRSQIFQGDLALQYENQLPFELTPSQKEAIEEIRSGLQVPHQFIGLIQGDVGSGKTVVGLIAALYSIEAGHQTCFLAPTEILAQQHYKEAKSFESLGLRVALLTGSLSPKEKQSIYQDCAEGNIDILVGTHALFNAELHFKSLGLCLIDEQHRFGVDQRNSLLAKGDFPDVLQYTATPIPRSLVQTLYGDSKAIVIGAKPEGRKPIKTRTVPHQKREKLKDFIVSEISQGARTYWVAPRVLDDEASDLASIESLYEEWKVKHPKALPLHGKMDDELKNKNLNAFKSGECDLLISTTVIEVGVNVPEASIIVIEGADRFGLAQLHQLRGRVGRGDQEAWCFLLTSEDTPEDTLARLQAFCETEDGFQIAELDLENRGAGDLSGIRQSGLKPFRFFDFLKDADLVTEMRAYCEQWIINKWS